MIEAYNLSKSYHQKVFEHLSFTVEEGSIVFITGASGAGKTTLLRILMGLETPDSGTLKCEAKHIAVVFQEDRLLEQFDIIDNIRLVSNLNRESIIGECCKLLPETDLTKKVKTYSGGMKRRAAILRAILCESEILLMDEPFKGLDRVSKEITMRYVKENLRGRTVFIITHDISETEMFHPEKVIVLEMKKNE